MNTSTRKALTGVAALMAAVTATGTTTDASRGVSALPAEAPAVTLPEGTYRTQSIAAEQLRATAVAAGFTANDVDAVLSGLGVSSVQISLRLADGGWTLSQSNDGAPDEIGWRGTYVVIGHDTVVASDPCGDATYRYTLDGHELTLDFVDTTCPGLLERLIQTMLYESAPFVLQPAEQQEHDADTTYASSTFVVPFQITLADWLAAEPSSELPNFVTWEATTVDRGLRVLVPVNVYPPGAATPVPPPNDYVSYLLAQADAGAQFADVVETTVDGRPTTVVTVTLGPDARPGSLDGSLGCQEDGLDAATCFGPQFELLLRLAVIDVDGTAVLVWIRDIRGNDDRPIEYETFDAMLASMRFVDRSPSTTP